MRPEDCNFGDDAAYLELLAGPRVQKRCRVGERRWNGFGLESEFRRAVAHMSERRIRRMHGAEGCFSAAEKRMWCDAMYGHAGELLLRWLSDRLDKLDDLCRTDDGDVLHDVWSNPLVTIIDEDPNAADLYPLLPQAPQGEEWVHAMEEYSRIRYAIPSILPDRWIHTPWKWGHRLGSHPSGQSAWPHLMPNFLNQVIDHWEGVEYGLREMSVWLEPFMASFGPGSLYKHNDATMLPGATDLLLNDAILHTTITPEDMTNQLWAWRNPVLLTLHQAMVAHDMSLKGARFGLPAATVKIMEEQMGPWFMAYLKYYKKKPATRVGMTKPGPYPSTNPFVPLVITGTAYDFISKAKAKKHDSDIVDSIVAAVITCYHHTQRIKVVMNQFPAVCHARKWIVHVWHEHHLRLHDGQFRDGAGLKGDGGVGHSQQAVANPLHNYPTGLDFQKQDAAFTRVYSVVSKCPEFMVVEENNISEDVMDEEITDMLERLGKHMRFNLGQRLLATYFQAVQSNDLPDISELHPKYILHYPPLGITTAKQMKQMAEDKYGKKPRRWRKGIKLMHTVQADSNDEVDTETNTTGNLRSTKGKGKAIWGKRSRPSSCSPSPDAPVLKKAKCTTAPNDGAVMDMQVQMPGQLLNVEVMPPASMISQAGPLTQRVTSTAPAPSLTEKPSGGNIDMDGIEFLGTMIGPSKAHHLND
ncbi:hypothetical protein K439DRAFT_1624614 [Ramaria rubella]|nr:hypothetical protein K439DRAFT_1624614 [Ramaria rubella]